MKVDEHARIGAAFRFHVVLTGHDLGGWATCSGLKVTFEVESVKEGGENGFVHKLPGRADYQNLTLVRALTAKGWSQTSSWLHAVQEAATMPPSWSDGHVTLLDAFNGTVARWQLHGVCPVSWTGPDLDAQKSAVALERLELAHHGFLA